MTATTTATSAVAPQWELAIGVDDLDTVAARARALPQGRADRLRFEESGRPALRLSGPEGLTFLVVQLQDAEVPDH